MGKGGKGKTLSWSAVVHVVLVQVSISKAFYVQLFWSKVFRAAFLYLQFGFVIFSQKNIGAKAPCKMLMKLTTGAQPHRHGRGRVERSLLQGANVFF